MTRVTVVALVLVGSLGGLLGAMPAHADSLSIGINIGSPPPPPPPAIVVAAPPQFVVVPGSPVHYAPGLSVNYFVYGGKHFTFHSGSWFIAASYGAPWTFVAVEKVPKPVLAVPVAYYKIPPGHMKKMEKGGSPEWAGGPGKGKGPKHKKGKDD